MDRIDIGVKLRECRIAKGLTQQQLSEAVGITPRYLSDIERGAKVPKFETFIRILNGLDASADYVLINVLNSAYRLKASILEESLESLRPDERTKILNILETMINNFKNQ